MKRLATLLLVALLLPLVACADSLISIVDLRAQVEASGGRWTQTYTSVRGETISVDVALNVPDVEAVPILRTSWMPQMPDQFMTDYGPNGSDRKEPRWYVLNDRYSQVAVNHNWDLVREKDEPGKGETEHPFRSLPHDNLDWNMAYAYNNDLPAKDALSYMIHVIQECYTRYGMDYYEPYLQYITLEDPLLVKGVQIRDTGAYNFNCQEAIRGIPILFLEGQGCNRVTPYYTLSIISQDSYSFSSKLHREIALLTDDVPLLSFDSIKPVYETMIQEGNLRDVFMVNLGYMAIYEEGKMEDEVFRLIPCWVLTGEYYDSAKEQANHEEDDALGIPLISRTSTKTIAVNAQTGEVIPRDASNEENHKLFNVKTW